LTRKRYVLHPGRTPGGKYIGITALARLYGLSPDQYISPREQARRSDPDYSGMIHLYVREDDDYSLEDLP